MNYKISWLFNNKFLCLCIFYTISFGMIIVNTGIYADDWGFFYQDTSVIASWSEQEGALLDKILFVPILSSFSHPIVFYRVSIFLLYFFSALFFYKILLTIKDINELDRSLLVLIFAIFPVNTTRITVMVFPYIVCYFLFFAAFWMFSRYLLTNHLIFRLLSLLMFFGAFSTNSFLAFYGIVLIYLCYTKKNTLYTLREWGQCIFRFGDFFILPIIFWILRQTLLRPHGVYQGYNQIRITNVYKMLREIHHVFYESFVHPISYAFELVFRDSMLVIFCGALVLWLGLTIVSRKYVQRFSDVFSKTAQWGLIIGFGALIAAVFPYCAVNKMPSMFDWGDRHQLLVPLGAAMILVYGIQVFVKANIRYMVYGLFVVVFTTANFLIYLDYQRDSFKQFALLEKFAASDVIKNNTTLLVQDMTADLNAMRRKYFFYEYTGMLKQIFDDETRLMIDVYDFLKRYPQNIEKRIVYPQYHIQHYQIRRPDYKIFIFYGEYPMTRLNAIRLIYQRYFVPQQFRMNINKIIRFEYVPIDDAQLQEISLSGDIPLDILLKK